MQSLLDQVAGDRRGSRSFYFEAVESERNIPSVPLAAHKVIHESDMFRSSRVTIIVPLYNYETYIAETLDSVRDQTLEDLDLIVVDDCSSDQSQSIARDWMETNKERFNRVLLVQHIENQGLGASRNTAIDLADTLYVMALDADNRLRPTCCAKCLDRIESTGSAFAYPTIQRFGDDNRLMGERDFFPADFIPGNGIDAMAMISKEAWALVGGYAIHRLGWQDFDFWCRVVSRGLPGVHVDEILAEYRVHQSSMLRTATDKAKNKLILLDLMEQYHPWLSLTSIERHGHRATPREA
jgi:glycosyltransferase involved in cell wall biosynthesis